LKKRLARKILAVVVAAFVGGLFAFGCTAKRLQTDLERLESANLAEPEAVRTDKERLRARAREFMDVCIADKFTSKLTYQRLEEFFESSEERDAFVATFAARLRKAGVRRDRLKSYKIEQVAIGRSEAMGFVRVRMKGHFWGPFNSELLEVIVWKKSGAEWFVWPQQQRK